MADKDEEQTEAKVTDKHNWGAADLEKVYPRIISIIVTTTFVLERFRLQITKKKKTTQNFHPML